MPKKCFAGCVPRIEGLPGWRGKSIDRIEDHFKGKDPFVRELYDLLFATLNEFGPVAAYALKTRIVFQAETQFAAALPRRRWLEGYLWLRRRAAHSPIRRVEMQVFRDYGHIFRLTKPADLDDNLVALLHEGYMLGCQPLAARAAGGDSGCRLWNGFA